MQVNDFIKFVKFSAINLIFFLFLLSDKLITCMLKHVMLAHISLRIYPFFSTPFSLCPDYIVFFDLSSNSLIFFFNQFKFIAVYISIELSISIILNFNYWILVWFIYIIYISILIFYTGWEIIIILFSIFSKHNFIYSLNIYNGLFEVFDIWALSQRLYKFLYFLLLLFVIFTICLNGKPSGFPMSLLQNHTWLFWNKLIQED